jgi:poly(A) polymerase/tRNA nucleotidyltransferase (CCA-adding enzyme)
MLSSTEYAQQFILQVLQQVLHHTRHPAHGHPAQQANLSNWIVGGSLRDMVMGRVPHDLDIATEGDGFVLARAIADDIGGSFVPLDADRGTGRVIAPPPPSANLPRLVVDIAQLRASTIEDDLALRDVTINALALPITETFRSSFPTPATITSHVIDPLGGMEDIAAGKLRACGPRSIPDDPLRILRVVRFAATLSFTITSSLDTDIRASVPRLADISAERIRDELLKILAAPAATPWLQYLDDVQVLTWLIPELEPSRTCEQPHIHFLPVLGHLFETVTVLEWLLEGLPPPTDPTLSPPTSSSISSKAGVPLPFAVRTYPHLPRTLPYAGRYRERLLSISRGDTPRYVFLKLAALLHDNAKPQTKQSKQGGGVTFYDHQTIGAAVAKTVAQRLRLSRQEGDYIQSIIREHMRPGQLRSAEKVTQKAVVRFFNDTGEAGPDVLLHSLADHMAVRGPMIDPHDWQMHLAWVRSMLDTHWGTPAQPSKPLVDGNDIMQTLGIEEGKLVGMLLREIRDAHRAKEISTREEAFALARQLAKKHQAHTG